MSNIDAFPTVPFNQPNTIRLISTAYIDEPAMQPLADNNDELDILEQLEGLTSARGGGELSLPLNLYPEELLSQHNGYGWTYINAAFCYTRPTGNRFNGPDRGAWYATWGDDAIETAHAEVTWHLTNELEAVGVFDNTTLYRELIASFTTNMRDLTKLDDATILSPDPKIAYPKGQALAATLRAANANGIVYPSVRRKKGKCLVAFRPNLVQNVRQGDCWSFTWSGSSTPSIKKVG